MRKKIGTVITVSDGTNTLYVAEGGKGSEFNLTPDMKHAKNFIASGKVLDTVRAQLVTNYKGTFTNTIERWAEQ